MIPTAGCSKPDFIRGGSISEELKKSSRSATGIRAYLLRTFICLNDMREAAIELWSNDPKTLVPGWKSSSSWASSSKRFFAVPREAGNEPPQDLHAAQRHRLAAEAELWKAKNPQRQGGQVAGSRTCRVVHNLTLSPAFGIFRTRPTHSSETEVSPHMAHIVTAPCNDCKYTDCCVVCPVECFYQDEMMLYIDPGLHRLRGVRPRVPGRGHLRRGQHPGPVDQLHPAQRREGRRPQGHRRRPHHREAGRQGRAGVQEEVVRQWSVQWRSV